MAFVLARHTVKDFRQWRSHFDGDIASRKAGGERTYQIFCLQNNPNDLVMLFEWDSLEHAREYVQSESLRAAMQEAGVVGEPEVCLLQEVDRGTT